MAAEIKKLFLATHQKNKCNPTSLTSVFPTASLYRPFSLPQLLGGAEHLQLLLLPGLRTSLLALSTASSSFPGTLKWCSHSNEENNILNSARNE
jgi:hypothetical protein